MKYEDLKKKFEINKKVKFKLYSLEYIIEMIDKEHHNNSSEPWYKLIELTAGNLLNYKNKIILKYTKNKIYKNKIT